MIVFVAGTRPELIKIGPVFAALQRQTAPRFICTGQHKELLIGTPIESDLRFGESLGLASDGNVNRWVSRAVDKLAERLYVLKPRLVVVQGDTMSALAGAIASVEVEVPLAHIEAGVRSHSPDEPWPEEANRVEIARLADWHYAPTSTAFRNLVAEGVPKERIRVTGNPVVSALARYTNAKHREHPDPHVLITLHRREVQNPQKATELLMGVEGAARMYPGVKFVWPIHPGYTKALGGNQVIGSDNLLICQPIGYEPFTRTLTDALGVITDSGGVVEEAATLGVPCVILRKHNDRPEAVDAGVATRMNPTGDNVVAAARLLVNEKLPRKPSSVFGQADAAEQIAAHLDAVASVREPA